MRRSLLGAVLALGVGIALAVPLFGASEKPGSSDEVQQLATRIQQLEQRVVQLERQSLTVRVVPEMKERVPRSWQRREFNGAEYYIVPCSQATADNRVE